MIEATERALEWLRKQDKDQSVESYARFLETTYQWIELGRFNGGHPFYNVIIGFLAGQGAIDSFPNRAEYLAAIKQACVNERERIGVGAPESAIVRDEGDDNDG